MIQNPSKRKFRDATTAAEIERRIACCLRDNLYGGKEKVVIEPFNGPRPAAPYASVHLSNIRAMEHDEYAFMTDEEDGQYIEVLAGEKYIRFRLQFSDMTQCRRRRTRKAC